MTSRVLGAAIKSGVLDASTRHLMGLGFNIYAGGATATFAGSTAYVTWEFYGERLRFNINAPALPDNALLTRGEADLIYAYFAHEMGHVAYTDNTQLKTFVAETAEAHRDRIFHVWNGLEDPRIEHATILSGKAAGARHLFSILLNRLTANLGPSWNPCDLRHAPFALAIMGREAFGHGNSVTDGLLDRIPEPKRGLYETALRQLVRAPLDRRGTGYVGKLAREFLAGWEKIEPEAFQTQPAQPFDRNPRPADEPGYQYGTQDESETEDRGEFVDDGSTQESEPGEQAEQTEFPSVDEDRTEEQADGASGGAGEVDDSEGGDSEGGAPNDGAGDDDAAESKHGAKGRGAAPGEDFLPFVDAGSSEGSVSPEPAIDEVLKRVTERTRAPVSLPPHQMSHRSDAAEWSKFANVTEEAQRKSSERLAKQLTGVGGSLKQWMQKLLVAPERRGWDAGAMSGKFDGRRVSRLLAGQETVFKQKWEIEGIDSAISILVDLSGSMQGQSIENARNAAYLLAQVAERCNVPVEVIGFTDRGVMHDANRPGYSLNGSLSWREREQLDASGAGWLVASRLIVFKPFGARLASRGRLFTQMLGLTGGGTPDYVSIRSAVEGIAVRPEQRKIVIVITDGFGDSQSVKQLCDARSLHGVEIIGIGIGSSDEVMSRAYNHYAAVDDIEQLAKRGMAEIIKSLKEHGQKRVA